MTKLEFLLVTAVAFILLWVVAKAAGFLPPRSRGAIVTESIVEAAGEKADDVKQNDGTHDELTGTAEEERSNPPPDQSAVDKEEGMAAEMPPAENAGPLGRETEVEDCARQRPSSISAEPEDTMDPPELPEGPQAMLQPAEPSEKCEREPAVSVHEVSDDEEERHDEDIENLGGATADVGDIVAATAAKEEGNVSFKNHEFEDAILEYSRGISLCPPDDHSMKAVLFANRAACRIMTQEFPKALEDCNASTNADESYAKAYLRRMRVNDKLEKWHDALSDCKKYLELSPELTEEPHWKREQFRLEQKSTELFEKEKEEMMGKMKDFGNWALGKVGLSLDNFKVEQNESGSYNISFNQ